jgi:hypothetical protein
MLLSRKVAGSGPDEVNDFVSISIVLQSALGPGVYSGCIRNNYQKQKIMFLGSNAAAGA